MTDQDVREFLERMAAEEPAPFVDAEPLARRARRRAARTAVVGAVGVAAAVAVVFAGVAEIRTAPVPAVQPTPAPSRSGALAYALGGDIYLADPDGSNAVKIADGGIPDTGCEGIGEHSAPSWSPDGRYLAFQRECPGLERGDVVITDPHGNVVAEGPSYGWGLTWSPDSSRVAVWKTIETIGVYGVDGERQALPLPPVTGGGNDAAPAWMPDGSALLVFGYAVVPLDGSAAHELSPGRSYSPDGTRYAVDMGHSFAIYDADGSAVSEASVRPDPRDPGVEAWSPHGERLASLSHGELNVVDVASGTVTVLTEARAALDGGDEILGVSGFSSQGDRILYETGDGTGLTTAALWSIGVDGSDTRLLVAGTTQGEWRPAPTLSPSPTPSPSPATPSPSQFTETFVSPLHGLSIGYPSDWQTRAATEPWEHGELAFDAPDVDVIFDPAFREDLYLAVVSQSLGGTARRDWPSVVRLDPAVGICKGAYGGGGGDDKLDGNYGWFSVCDTPSGSDSHAIIATATRGYIVYLHVGDEVPATYPVPEFEGNAAFEEVPEVGGGPPGFLETLELRPEAAVDTLSPSQSP